VGKGHTTRKALITITGRGTGWAKLWGAHTRGMAGVQGPGLCGNGYATHSGATNSYSLTAKGQAAVASPAGQAAWAQWLAGTQGQAYTRHYGA
jgi:hypothetical protein